MLNRNVPSIVCGHTYTLCLSVDKNIVSFGKSNRCGHGHEEEEVFPPKIIPSLKNIKSIATGSHCICLDDNGNVFSFGCNHFGQLGVGYNNEELEYTHIPQKVNLPPCKEVSCGFSFSVFLTNDGELYSCGCNRYGQLGLETTEILYNIPQKIDLQDIDFVECGCEHVICKSYNNSLYCWGGNLCGELGIGNSTDYQFSPIQGGEGCPNDVIDIKCGFDFSIVLTSNQDVYFCGNNFNGPFEEDIQSNSYFLKKVDGLSEIIRIECGKYHSMCINVYNELFVFGNNNYAQLGLGDTIPRNTPIKHPSLSNVVDFSKGAFHTFVKTSDNEIYAFGKGTFELGIESNNGFELFPTQVLKGNEDIWYSNISRPTAKSARSVV